MGANHSADKEMSSEEDVRNELVKCFLVLTDHSSKINFNSVHFSSSSYHQQIQLTQQMHKLIRNAYQVLLDNGDPKKIIEMLINVTQMLNVLHLDDMFCEYMKNYQTKCIVQIQTIVKYLSQLMYFKESNDRKIEILQAEVNHLRQLHPEPSAPIFEKKLTVFSLSNFLTHLPV